MKMDKNIYRLYSNSELYKLWPIDEEEFLRIVYGLEDVNSETKIFEVRKKGSLLGFLSAKFKITEDNRKGVIIYVYVKKEQRKKGIGSELVQKAVKWFREMDANEIVVGGGAGKYFWPGLPQNIDSQGFFEKNGFKVEDKGCVDMYQNILDYVPPKGVYDTLKENNVLIEFSNEVWKDKILKFAKKNFIQWYDFYLSAFDREDYQSVFFAHTEDEVIAISELPINDCNWNLLFENNVGRGGALGVLDTWRGKGIGLAMKSWGTEKLRDMGAKYVWISWTFVVGFYKKLGFEVWRKFYNVKLLN